MSPRPTKILAITILLVMFPGILALLLGLLVHPGFLLFALVAAFSIPFFRAVRG